MSLNRCSGACDQGRKACVTPEACERAEEWIENDATVPRILTVVHVVLIGCCAVFIWGLLA